MPVPEERSFSQTDEIIDDVRPAAATPGGTGVQAAWHEAMAGGLATDLGGLWYLVNVLVSLDLVADDGQGVDDLGPWDKLAVLAATLLDHRSYAVAQRPVVRNPPAETEKAPQGLRQVAEATSQLQTGGFQPLGLFECVVSPVDQEIKEDAVARDPVWAVLAELAGHDLELKFKADERANPFEGWLGRHLPIIDAWLADISGAALSCAAMPPIIRQRATLYVTRTHVDVVFSLEQINLSIRRAGLDRNPGWVPELGRVITFRFE
jgi:hypothetical protein